MKIQTSTAWLPVLDICTYWGELSSLAEELKEGVSVKELDPYIIRHASEKITEILNEVLEDLGKVSITDVSIYRPDFYNFSGDVLLYTVEIEDDTYTNFMDSCDLCNKKMYAFFAENYGSSLGFISRMPYTQEKFCEAFEDIRGDADFEKAFSMYLYWCIREKLSEEELDEYQRDFVDSVNEEVQCNTDLCIAYDDDGTEISL